MRVEQAYMALTKEARAEAIKVIGGKLKALRLARRRRGREGDVPDAINDGYIRQILLAKRAHPCSEAISKAVSGYFTGDLGLNVRPDEARGVPEGWQPADSNEHARAA